MNSLAKRVTNQYPACYDSNVSSAKLMRISRSPDLRKGTKATRIVRFLILTGLERDETRGDFGKPKAGTAR